MGARKKSNISVRIQERKLSGNRTSFYLDYSSPTIKRTRISLNLIATGGKRSEDYRRSKATAEEIKQKKIEELRQRQYGVSNSEQQLIFLHVLFNDYLSRYDKKDVRRVKSVTNYVKEFFSPNLYVQDLEEWECEDFAKMLVDKLKKETARNYFLAFKKVLKDAKKRKIIQSVPAEEISIKAPNDRLIKEVLTKDELITLEQVECGNEELKRAFLLSSQTGLGYTDCLNLKWSQIRTEGNSISLKYDRSKTGIYTEVILNNPARRFLQHEGQKDGLVFTKIPSTNEGANKTIQSWIKRAGIDKHITFYCARHTFGTLQAINGVNQNVIAQNMGHASPKHTAQYINHVDEAKAKAVEAIGNW
jgi:integrase